MVKAVFNINRSNAVAKLPVSILCLVSLLITLGTSMQVFADTSLSASVDRNKIYEMDTLNLSIQGELDVDFSFGGLMNFGLNQTEKPDTSALEKNFEILDTQQSYNMQSINGETKAKVNWRYTLAPRSTGNLEIPPIKFKGAQTKPIIVSVLEGSAPKNSEEPPSVFLEVETDKTSAYVQEQIIYTLRLYTQGLINGELSDPKSADAIIEPFGEQKKYYRMAYNQRYEVIERQYLIFPQKSGSLAIPKQEFQGVAIKHGRRTRIRDFSESLALSIKAPPANFSGKIWLPATSLYIQEQWTGDPSQLKVGDSLSRRVTLSSLGLLGSALPPVSMKDQPSIKLYTDKPQIETKQHENGAQASRVDSFAIVALNEGEIQLDEIRIPWWDIVNDVERVAIIPASTIKVLPNPDVMPSKPETNANVAPIAQDNEGTSINSDTSNHRLAEQRGELTGTNKGHFWPALTVLILLAWIITSTLLYKRISHLKASLNAIPLPKDSNELSEKLRYNEVISAIKQHDSNQARLILDWLGCFDKFQSSNKQPVSLQALKHLNLALYDQLSAFDALKYSPDAKGCYDEEQLLQVVKKLREGLLSEEKTKHLQANRHSKKRTLIPFYPQR